MGYVTELPTQPGTPAEPGNVNLLEPYEFHLGKGNEVTFYLDTEIGRIHCIVLPGGNVSAYAYHRGIVVSPNNEIVKSLPPLIDLYRMDSEEIWTQIRASVLAFITHSARYKAALMAYGLARDLINHAKGNE